MNGFDLQKIQGERAMNIIEAVKSGKNFARKQKDKNDYLINCKSQEYVFDIEDILATDWEIEERKIEISESEFDVISQEVACHDGVSTILYALKKRLFEK